MTPEQAEEVVSRLAFLTDEMQSLTDGLQQVADHQQAVIMALFVGMGLLAAFAVALILLEGLK